MDKRDYSESAYSGRIEFDVAWKIIRVAEDVTAYDIYWAAKDWAFLTEEGGALPQLVRIVGGEPTGAGCTPLMNYFLKSDWLVSGRRRVVDFFSEDINNPGDVFIPDRVKTTKQDRCFRCKRLLAPEKACFRSRLRTAGAGIGGKYEGILLCERCDESLGDSSPDGWERRNRAALETVVGELDPDGWDTETTSSAVTTRDELKTKWGRLTGPVRKLAAFTKGLPEQNPDAGEIATKVSNELAEARQQESTMDKIEPVKGLYDGEMGEVVGISDGDRHQLRLEASERGRELRGGFL